ncbi:MAG: hypothetical protein ACRDPM_27055 [Solirubrobacteraceae bacterium]
MSSQSPGFIGRIRQLRGAAASQDAVALPEPASTGTPAAAETARWEARIAHLEQLVQGLQDSVYREAQRQEKRLAEIEKRLDPAALAAALSQNARERGL